MKRVSKIITVALLFAFAVILTVFSQRASEYARDGLKICAISVIPSLFPYMVISQMIISGGGVNFIGRLLPISRLYGLPTAASAPIFLGAVCGFPVGAKSACEMYKKGALTKTETEVLISAANNTGPSFVVSVIGASFFGSTIFGWQLYAFQLISSVIATVVVNRLFFPFPRSPKKSLSSSTSKTSFFSAVSDSVSSVLTVCGFIVFFTVIFGFVLPYISDISPSLAGVFSSILEFTGGARLASAIGGTLGQFLCGLAVGWSGISVFCQTAAFTASSGLSLKRCICTKALQGVLTGVMATIPRLNILSSAGTFPEIYNEASVLFTSPVPTAVISGLLYIFLIKKLSNTHKI